MKKILVVGDIIIDNYVYGSVDRLAPDFLGMVFDEIAQDTYLGGAGLVAQTLANIAPEEVEITLEGSLPPMYEKLLNPRIKLNRVSEEAMIKTRYVASGQGRPDKPWGSQKIIRVDNIKKFKQSTKVEDSARDGYDYVVISDYNKGTVPIGFKVASTNPMVIADTKSNTLTKYNRVDLLKINQSEYQTLQTEIANVKHTVITYGRKPVEVKNFGYKAYTVPTYELSIHDRVEYDPCGAGDSFLAGLIVGLVYTDNNLHKSIKYANIAASLKVFSFGTEAISKVKFERELNNAQVSSDVV